MRASRPYSAVVAVLAAVLADAAPPAGSKADDLAVRLRVEDVEGTIHSGELTGLTGWKLLLRLDGGEARTFNAADLLRVESAFLVPRLSLGTRNRPDGPAVHLANGDRLFLEPVRSNDEFLEGKWVHDPGQPEVKVPLVTVKALVFEQPVIEKERLRLTRTLLEHDKPADLVLLRNGDRLTGQFERLSGVAVVLKDAEGRAGEVPRSSVQAVAFNPRYVSFPKIEGLRAIVTLTDGSRFTARGLALGESGTVIAEAAFGGRIELPVRSLASLQFLGGRAVYLSDVEPADYAFTPYLPGLPAKTEKKGGRGKAERAPPLRTPGLPLDPAPAAPPLSRDRSVAGGSLSLRGREFAKGLGMHSRSRATYALDGRYASFRATVGIDDSTAGGGAAVFAVEVDGKRVFASPPLTGRDDPLPVGPVDLRGAGRLTLVVDYGPRADILDRGNWCDAVIIRPPERAAVE